MSVAAVLVDTGLAHLDRAFEYSVPEELAASVSPGVRVKVRFAGRDLDGFVVALRAQAEHPGRLQPIRRVVSPEQVLIPPVLQAAERVAAVHAGLVGDVLRLAVPPRHARAERALASEPPEQEVLVWPGESQAWARYPAGPALVRRLAAGESPQAAWSALPASDPALDWTAAFADAAVATVASGRGAILLAPDHRDVARLDAALSARLGRSRHVVLTADQGPQARYTAFLKVLRGHVPVAIGTRAAAWAPVVDLGLIAWWDDGDDLWEEPRAPYAHIREVARVRAGIAGAALVTGGFGRSVAVQAWVESDVVKDVVASRETVRSAAARVVVAGEEHERDLDPVVARARIPGIAWRTAKAALGRGPVLVQVPRRGYVPSLACQHCRRRAQCRHCGGALGLTDGEGTLVCRLCHTRESDFRCPQCHGREVRALTVGARRTAEEIGRAFPGVPVHTSGASTVLTSVPPAPSLVIATPGAEPVVDGGYAAALLLDAWALLDRPSIDAGVEALRRWMGAAALVRGAAEEGTVVLCGAPDHGPVPAVEGLSRWDAPWLAARELGERADLALPPATVMALVTGERRAVTAVADGELPEAVTSLGPVPAPDGSARLVLRVPECAADELAHHLASVRRIAQAKKAEEQVAIRMRVPDPTM
ncbi:MAG: primosome assembly protein PriA [Dermatophilaceae bacterium]